MTEAPLQWRCAIADEFNGSHSSDLPQSLMATHYRLGRMLIDGRTGYRGLGETRSDRGPKSRYGSLSNVHEICSKRSVGSLKIRVTASIVRVSESGATKPCGFDLN